MSEYISPKMAIQPRVKWKKRIKMALPHVGLYLSLFAYLLAGATMFHWLEYDADDKIQRDKLDRIKKDYKEISNSLSEMAPNKKRYHQFKRSVFAKLSQLSSMHEGRPFHLDFALSSDDALPPHWSKSSSFLYALSILTTTGYSYAVPVTPFGQLCAIVYGLLGIPLMVLAAVDIGRFLSHIVLELYSKYRMMSHKMFCRKKALLPNTKTVLRRKKHESPSTERKYIEENDDDDASNWQEANCKSCHPNTLAVNDEVKQKEEDSDKEKENGGKRLPLSINAAILLVFCMMGGVTYIAAGGEATFLEAFFVTFNLVANLTMSEMPSDLNHILTLIYIFAFVTFGTNWEFSLHVQLRSKLVDKRFSNHNFSGQMKITPNFRKNKS